MTPSQAPHLRLGRAGEAAAEALLAGKGFTVLARNYRMRGGEVDLVCQDGETVVFVEVKTRGAGSLARPDQAVTAAKRGRLVRAAAACLSERDLGERPCRVDVVAVTASGKTLTATHLPDAFILEDGMGTGNFYQPG
ncbi:YraN family protein [Solidesulfovibrio sp.]|uniref:YraN family protein n=1 Tax=Solidesulfovibrio sp. TaxID=2910990 RepID=UPI002B1F8966|nr:YraN family protein [Solidesulfovibrio sp.]MEA5089581.1 YraN family protein [Solidesulfovibrio sp.]